MRIYIIVPSFAVEAPVKGAIALANYLITKNSVTIISLKPPKTIEKTLHIHHDVKIINLANETSWLKKLKNIKAHLLAHGGREKNAIISFCLSADIFTSFLGRYAILISSIRGNLPSNYRVTYGTIGVLLARLQFFMLKKFDFIVAMSDSMKDQLLGYGFKRVCVIGNFLDETILIEKRATRKRNISDKVRFIYLGRLVPLKKPIILLDIINRLSNEGLDCYLDIVGDGPLFEEIKNIISELKLSSNVKLHGHSVEPYELLQECDFLVLPSVSEGISRAVMEALYFGVPCIIRNIDAADEIIQQGVNGELFETDDELYLTMKNVTKNIASYRDKYKNENLLSQSYSQKCNALRYHQLLTLKKC